MDKKQYQPREYLFSVNEQEVVRAEGWNAFMELLGEYDGFRRTGKLGPFLRFCLENGTVEREDGSRSMGVYSYLVTKVVRPVSIGLVAKPDLDRVQAKGGRAYEWFCLAKRAFELANKGADNDEEAL